MMIDLETLSLMPDAYVLQIGVSIADRHTGEWVLESQSYFIEESGQEGRRKDLDTIRFWAQQDPVVADSVFLPTDSRYSIAESFEAIWRLVCVNNIQEVWAGPAMFDLPVLTSLWGNKPWIYNTERDLGTIKKLFDPRGELLPPPNEMFHNAAADARWQMQYLINLTREYHL